MNYLVVLSLVAVAFAKPTPDVSHLTGGYNYKAPSHNSGYEYRPPTTSYGVPIHHVDHHSSGSNQHHEPTGSYLPPVNQELPSLNTHVDFSSNYQSGSSAHFNGLYNPSLIQDQKHVYYFAARDLDEEQPRLRINVIPNHQKNTNVIFVKAPSYPAPIPEVHAPPSSIEDKTKVVVLVKKPEHQGPINVHAPPATKHGNPEVFVVKYNNQHEAEHVVASGNGGYPLGAPVDQVRSEHHFVETLKSRDDDKYHNLGNLGVSGSSDSASAGLYKTGSGNIGIRISGNDDSFVGGSLESLKGASHDSSSSLGSRGSFESSSLGGSSFESSSLGDSAHGSSSLGGSSLESSSFSGSSLKSDSLVDASKDSSHIGHIAETYELGDSFLDSSKASGGSSYESSSSGKTRASSGRGIKITIENDEDEASSGSSVSDSVAKSSHTKTLEDDELFSKYGPPGESGPY